MKIVLQKVKNAKVIVAGEVIGAIGKGSLLLLGIEKGDTPAHADELIKKVLQLRIFPSASGVPMDLSSIEVNGEFLVVSQFTLAADLSKGNRPSFDQALEPLEAEKLYLYFVEQLKKGPCRVATGKFRAMMEVVLSNDGPVTLILSNPAKKEDTDARD